MIITPNNTVGLVAPFGAEEQQAQSEFPLYLYNQLQRMLKPHGFRGVAISAGARSVSVVAEMGDGTPVTVRMPAGDAVALDPGNALGMGDGFAELVAHHIADLVLAEAHRILHPLPPRDLVKEGRIGWDGFCCLELGAELRHMLGDQCYEMDAELKGEKEPKDPTKATNLNPASSTPRDRLPTEGEL